MMALHNSEQCLALPLPSNSTCLPACLPAPSLSVQGREQEAQNVFMQCVDVTADMAHEVAVRLR
jgi:hypothetical protein